MPTFTFKAQTPRRFPDPTFPNCVRHIFFCAATDVPVDLPKGANPRTQDDIDRGIYRDVKRSLLNIDCTPNSFHLKNKGITIIAEDVQKQGEDILTVVFSSEEQGIVDGAHTYEMLIRNQADIVSANADANLAISQFVKVEILVGLPLGLVTEVAGGLNTAVQVQRMSLADLDDKFDWIKDCLAGSNFLEYIAFKQNEIKEFDVRDVLRLLDLFNITEFPNNGSSYPIRAYTSKESVLKHYLDKDKEKSFADNYKCLAPILKDILVLHDTISADARELYNAGGGRRAGRLKFVEGPSKPDKKYHFPFIADEREYRLSGGALIPMLGAFRAAVKVDDQSGMMAWKDGLEEVLHLWEKTGRDLMDATQETSEELGRNPNAIGKSKKHWAFLHNMVERQIS